MVGQNIRNLLNHSLGAVNKMSSTLWKNVDVTNTRVCTVRHNSASTPSLVSNEENSKWTVNDVLEKWSKVFTKCSVSQPKQSIQSILAYVLEVQESDVYGRKDVAVSSDDIQRINSLCTQRLQRIPIEYIVQKMNFRDLDLKMTRPVFIPWPETVGLVDIVAKGLEEQGVNKVLELCSGSGAICLGLLKARPQLHITTIDKSDMACKLTKENADRNNLSDRIEIIQTEITADCKIDAIKEKYNVIVSNPPYVPTKEFDNLEPEITLYNDRAAFNGGEDGMDMMKRVLKVCSGLLNPDGRLYLEVFPTLPPLINSWLRENPNLRLSFVRSFRDFRGDERYVEVKKEK